MRGFVCFLTTGADSPLARMFITGVTPITLDDVTSGFNIATNISLDPMFADFAGFTHDDLKTMLAYYRANAGFEFDENAADRDLAAPLRETVGSRQKQAPRRVSGAGSRALRSCK